VSQQETGRVRQKQRTRAILLAAARDMLAKGEGGGVAEVADRAGISRATAYRYYSSADVLMHEAVLDGIANELDTLDFTAADAKAVDTRIALMVEEILAMVLRNEALFRTYLRSTLTDTGTPRGGRRIRWMQQALGDDRAGLSAGTSKRLVHALALLSGIETIIVLRDVCALDDKEILEVARWSANALVQAALKEKT